MSALLTYGCGGQPPNVTDIREIILTPVTSADAGAEEMRITGNQSQPNTLVTGNHNPVSGLQIGITSPDGKPESGTITVQFNVKPPAAAIPGPGGTFVTEAIVNWAISSNRVTRRISVANGVTISGVGEGVTVQLVDQTISTDIQQILGAKYEVDVQAGLGVRGSVAQLPTLIEQQNQNVLLAPLGSTTIPIPQDAGVIAVQVVAINGSAGIPDKTVVRFTSNFANFNTFNVALQDGMVPVPPGATFIVVNNNNAADTSTIGVIWGIDG